MELENYCNELLTGRIKQAEIKEKYGVKSLEYLIVKLDGELISLYDRRNSGENMDLAIHNKEERKSEYEKSLLRLFDNTEKEKRLTMSTPVFKGIIRIIKSRETDMEMHHDPEIEKIGMRVSMDFEITNNRFPEDVSLLKSGFDIKSKDESGNFRYIEVKARAGQGSVELTQNEWFNAMRFRNDYFLYVVLNAAKTPELFVIQNPFENLIPKEKIETVRYVIAEDEIINKAGYRKLEIGYRI